MKVALLVDDGWLQREPAVLRRLAMGLREEKIDTCLFLPDTINAENINLTLCGEIYYYSPSNWDALKNRRIKSLIRNVCETEEPFDIFHTLDGSLNQTAIRIAAEFNAAALTTIWSKSQAANLTQPPANTPFAITTPTKPLADAARATLSKNAIINYVPPGVYASPSDNIAPPLLSPLDSLACLIVGDGKPDNQYLELLKGMADRKDSLRHAIYFFYAAQSQQHKLYSLASDFNLLNQISFIDTNPGERSLLIQADAIIQPQSIGIARTLILQSMAAKRPVIAAYDSAIDFLKHEHTAHLLTSPTAADWARMLDALVDDKNRFIQLGESASVYIAEHHKVSAFVAGIANTYRKLVPESIKLKTS